MIAKYEGHVLRAGRGTYLIGFAVKKTSMMFIRDNLTKYCCLVKLFGPKKLGLTFLTKYQPFW